ncbi:MAG: acyl--CoA ligase, partial [Nitrosarchaeum sp.]|nr:acyl--CoA ligase [Nitrosarchaeum sp.]
SSNHKYTYKELFESVKSFSSYIEKFPKNSVVSLLFENSADFIISYLGTLYASCIAHILPIIISDENLVKQIESAEPKIIITTKQFIKKIEKIEKKNIEKFDVNEIPINYNSNVKRKPVPENISYLLYTSGTTTFPKGVPVTHQNCVFTTKNIIKILNYSENDVNIIPLPLYHSFGLGCFRTSIYTGATLILHKNATDISELSNSIKNNSASTLALVPANLTKILHDPKDGILDSLSRLRLVITNTTSIPTDTVKEYRKILKNGNFATYYGLTEASRSTFMIFDKDRKENSVGLPAPGVELKLVDYKNNTVDKGEIWIRGGNIIRKYWKNPEADKNIVDG